MVKIVMAFGSFDFLHEGHLYYFREAKKLGDKLIVIVGRDSTIEKVKGRKPRLSEEERLAEIRKIGFIDEAVLGYENDQFKVLDDFKPDIICLGYDQKSFITEKLEQELKKRGIMPRIIRIEPFNPEIYKSSKLRGSVENAVIARDINNRNNQMNLNVPCLLGKDITKIKKYTNINVFSYSINNVKDNPKYIKC